MSNAREAEDQGLVDSHVDKLKTIVAAALERNAQDPVVLDVGDLTSYTETLVIMSGNSSRQVRAISSHIVKTLKAHGDYPLGVEGGDTASWILVDANDVIVHIFDPETRVQFDIEGLWSDAPKIELELSRRPAATGDDMLDPVPDPAD